MKTSSIVALTVGTTVTALTAYAVYFDYRRRTDPVFRKSLRQDYKRQAKAAKEHAQAEGVRKRQLIKDLVKQAKEEGFPKDAEDRETYFMTQVTQGEKLSQDEDTMIDSAFCFYKGLRVYPAPQDLVHVYESTIPKSVLEYLSQFIAADDSLKLGSLSGGGAGSDMD